MRYFLHSPFFISVLLSFFSGLNMAHAAAEQVIRIPSPQSNFDASHDYFSQLILLALSKPDENGKTLPKVTVNLAPQMVQQRALEELRAGRSIDIYWSGTSHEREKNLRAIRIPLTKGLLGFRTLVINKKNRALFDSVNNLQDLQKLTFCQGQAWPDTDILLAAGLSVIPSASYENMFRQVAAGRCDAFPRGMQEAEAEIFVRKLSYPDLEIYDRIILHYPFPMYLFVNRDNKKLARRLEQGLEIAIDDGSFDDLLKTHPVTAHLFPLDRWINRHYILINNPLLPADTDIHNARYWISPPQQSQPIQTP